MEKIKQVKSKTDREIEILEQQKNLLGYMGSDKIISSHEKFEEIKKAEQADKINFRIMSGISFLDEMIEGFRLGTVNVVSGPTGEGKTTWAQTLTSNFSKQGINSVWFSFEVMPAEFFSKFGNNVPLFYLPKEMPEQTNLSWMRQRILEAQAKYNAKVVFIDHLHYLSEMQGLNTQEKTSLLIGDIMRKVKKMANDLEIAIFLIAHLKSEAGGQAQITKCYTKDDIRDSSFVKQEADTVMMIWRKRERGSPPGAQDIDVNWHYSENTAILNFDKNRRTGKIGFVLMSHENQKFIDVEKWDIEQPQEKEIDANKLF